MLLLGGFFIFIAFVMASGVLWILACRVAPLGYEISFGRVGTAVILLAIDVVLTKTFLVPIGGVMLGALVFTLLAILIVKSVLRLSLRHSVLVALIYIVLWIILCSLILLCM